MCRNEERERRSSGRNRIDMQAATERKGETEGRTLAGGCSAAHCISSPSVQWFHCSAALSHCSWRGCVEGSASRFFLRSCVVLEWPGRTHTYTYNSPFVIWLHLGFFFCSLFMRFFSSLIRLTTDEKWRRRRQRKRGKRKKRMHCIRAWQCSGPDQGQRRLLLFSLHLFWFFFSSFRSPFSFCFVPFLPRISLHFDSCCCCRARGLWYTIWFNWYYLITDNGQNALRAATAKTARIVDVQPINSIRRTNAENRNREPIVGWELHIWRSYIKQ